MVASSLARRWIRAAVVSALAVLALLCAGGGADAAMVFVAHDPDMACGVDDNPNARPDCRAATPELPSLAMPAGSIDVTPPDQHDAALGVPVVRIANAGSATPRVPRAPPLA